jgi:3-hydroxyacyl-CoA dehydrogenase/3-hydroxy-2-methylbutyryl-CoA dehydrogenase
LQFFDQSLRGLAAIAGLTLPFARELAGFGVRVMTVAPGVFDTPMTRGMPPEYNAVAEKLQQFPKRSGKPSEFASLVQTILENTMLNGSVVRLDGGMRL